MRYVYSAFLWPKQLRSATGWHVFMTINQSQYESEKMRPIATDGVVRSVCLSVCLSVCWSRSWALQKRLNRSRCRKLGWARRTMYYIGSRDPPGRGNFGVVRPTVKHWESVLRRFTQQKSITTTAGLQAPVQCSRLDWPVSHYTHVILLTVVVGLRFLNVIPVSVLHMKLLIDWLVFLHSYLLIIACLCSWTSADMEGK